MNRKRSLPQQTESSPEKKAKICVYLEDNTPVRTIEVSNVPTDSSEDCTEEFIRRYFERVGPVESVEIARKPTNDRLAYVTFMNPEDAAALIHNEHVAGYAVCSKFAIKIADDAHQIDRNVLSLEQVNDDCLLYMMTYLTLFDVINLSKASKRLQSVGQLYYRKFTNLSIGQRKWSVWSQRNSYSGNVPYMFWLQWGKNLPVILEAIGDHISSIDCSHRTAIGLLAKYCPNVTELKLAHIESETKTAINGNKDFFKNLKQLYIEDFHNLCDLNVRCMMSGEKLRTLHVLNCNRVRGKFFTKTNHVKLKDVKIDFSPSLENFNWNKWFSKVKDGTLNPANEYVDVSSMIDKLSQNDSLARLILERIMIDTNTIQALRSLKYLKLLDIHNKIGKNLYEQIREYIPTLRELSVDEGPYIIMENEIFDIIAGMPMLHYFSHRSITWEWLDGFRQYKSITALVEKKSPLRIGVTEYMFNDPKKEAFEAIHKGAITLCVQDWHRFGSAAS